MAEKRIVIDIKDNGEINAETFEMIGTECIDELDKLLKDLALETETKKKEEYFKTGIKTDNKISIKHDQSS